EGKEVYYRASSSAQSELLHTMIEQVMKISCPETDGHKSHNHGNDSDISPAPDRCGPCSRDSFSCVTDRCASTGKDINIPPDQLEIICSIHKDLTEHIDRRWTVDELARKYLMNPTTLKSLFKSVYGKSLAAHIKEHRMEHAATLLSGTAGNLADVAGAIGYESQSKFTAAFKEYYGILPKDYRKNRPGKVLVILAGGLSSRMGTDKTFLKVTSDADSCRLAEIDSAGKLPFSQETGAQINDRFSNLTFIDTILDNANKVFDRVIISAGSAQHAETIYTHLKNRNLLCTRSMPEIIIDRYNEIGPMGGLLSVMEQTNVMFFSVTAIDQPYADMQLLSFLFDEIKNAGSDSVRAVMIQSPSGKIEACTAAYGRNAYPAMKASYEQGQYSLFRSIGRSMTKILSPDEIEKALPALSPDRLNKAVSNINTVDDYRDYLSRKHEQTSTDCQP
ncbi:MAG: helix-turn-helix domain-containing protein, partial [Parasporobacterium sp.]|nr:helix-turn-helix domain-containing protein [Parasporobacterium sp.]